MKTIGIGTNLSRDCSQLLGRVFSREGHTEVIATSVLFDAGPDDVWRQLLTYEEIPGRPPFPLRTLLPVPIRTEGDKTRVGSAIHCFYRGGNLIKVVTACEPPCLFEFEVTRQNIGIESCVRALCGSYRIRPRGDGSEVVLSTTYRAHLRPRFFWRPLEAFLIHSMHRYILEGMRRKGLHPAPEPLCATSHSPSRP
jgi:hypothetical protein